MSEVKSLSTSDIGNVRGFAVLYSMLLSQNRGYLLTPEQKGCFSLGNITCHNKGIFEGLTFNQYPSFFFCMFDFSYQSLSEAQIGHTLLIRTPELVPPFILLWCEESKVEV